MNPNPMWLDHISRIKLGMWTESHTQGRQCKDTQREGHVMMKADIGMVDL